MAEVAVVNYKKLTDFVGTYEGAELRRALALKTVRITQDKVNGEHIARIAGPPELILMALAAAGLTSSATGAPQ